MYSRITPPSVSQISAANYLHRLQEKDTFLLFLTFSLTVHRLKLIFGGLLFKETRENQYGNLPTTMRHQRVA